MWRGTLVLGSDRGAAHLRAAFGLVLALTACNGSNSTGPGSGSGSGSLTVTITAPTGVTPAVTVSGPGGYSKVLSGTTTLTGLVAGSYTVQGAPVMTPALVVGAVNAATVAGSPASVAVGATAQATVAYAPRPGSGALWIGTDSPSVVQYTAGQLAASTNAAPATSIATGAIKYGEARSVAFDAGGNLWVGENQWIVEYSAAQLTAGGDLTPTVLLAAGGRHYGLAFDAAGNLWASNFDSSTVAEFTASQLVNGGSPTPAVVLSSADVSLFGPMGLAFDQVGNLWVANYQGATVVEFAANQLGSSGSPKPAVTLMPPTGSPYRPQGLAFDAPGNLWLTNVGGTILEFTGDLLAASGSPTPAITLSDDGSQSLATPWGLAFDASGDLWVACFGAGRVVEFTPNQLAASGAPTAAVTVSSSSLIGLVALAFDPHGPNLPLKP